MFSFGKKKKSSIEFVVQSALENEQATLTDVLRTVAEAFDACGCVLWDSTPPNADLKTDPPEGHLFVAAAWFDTPDDLLIHDLPIADSATGQVMIHELAATHSDIQITGGQVRTHPFITSNNIHQMSSVPVRMSDGGKGALNVYRRGKRRTAINLNELGEIANLVIALEDMIQNRSSLRLLQEVDRTLHDAEVNADVLPLPKREKKSVLTDICQHVAMSLGCVEVSIFLEDWLDAPGKFSLQATTWSENVYQEHYEASESDGITGWVLKNVRHVRIFDLLKFHRDAEIIQREYPGLSWRKEQNAQFAEGYRSKLKLTEDQPLPPASQMAVPILAGKKMLGVIRCCAARFKPYYFSGREIQQLQLVANRIEQSWIGWMNAREMQAEGEWWRCVVDGINELNDEIGAQFRTSALDSAHVSEVALEVAANLFGHHCTLDVRRVDHETQSLRFESWRGRDWYKGKPVDVRQRRKKTFTLVGDNKCTTGAEVVAEGKVKTWYASEQSSNREELEFFPNTRRLLSAPIRLGDKTSGVIDVLDECEDSFSQSESTLAVLLGAQLGLYYELIQSIQPQMFEDLAHQLKSPILLALMRLELALRSDEPSNGDKVLAPIRGLIRKAWRATNSMRLLADLSQGRAIVPSPRPTSYSYLIKVLGEAADDAQLLIPMDRRISFDLDKRSFKKEAVERMKVDHILLEQAISNLCDNAAKYSFPNTSICITGEVFKKGVNVIISNVGFRITAEEARLCKQRGWRGEGVRSVGEGTGIGLWIVDKIMEAHNGQLIVAPTTEDGVTEVRLAFPCS